MSNDQNRKWSTGIKEQNQDKTKTTQIEVSRTQ